MVPRISTALSCAAPQPQRLAQGKHRCVSRRANECAGEVQCGALYPCRGHLTTACRDELNSSLLGFEEGFLDEIG